MCKKKVNLSVLRHDSPINCETNSYTICIPAAVYGTVVTLAFSGLQVASWLWLSHCEFNTCIYKTSLFVFVDEF